MTNVMLSCVHRRGAPLVTDTGVNMLSLCGQLAPGESSTVRSFFAFNEGGVAEAVRQTSNINIIQPGDITGGRDPLHRRVVLQADPLFSRMQDLKLCSQQKSPRVRTRRRWSST
jgi:hypothetical protein